VEAVMPEYTRRQKQIIEAAIDVIAAEGIQSLTIKNLAAAIGVTEPAIYRHFRNKHEILESVLTYFAWESRRNLKAALESEQFATRKIGAFLAYYLDTFTRRPALAAVVFSEDIFPNDRRLARSVLKLMEQSQQILSQIVGEKGPDNDVRDDIAAEQVVTIVLGSLRFLVNKWHLSRQGFDLRKEGNRLVRSLLQLITRGD
jgi:AcrR family transcriptional regulator